MADSSDSYSLKATIERFKKFAADCADAALRAANSVKSRTIRGNGIQLASNVNLPRQPCDTSPGESDLTEPAYGEDCEAKPTLMDLLAEKSSIALEKLQDASKALEELSKEAAKNAEEVISNSATTLVQASEDVSKAVKEKADEVASSAKGKVDSVAKTAAEKADAISKSAAEHADWIAKTAAKKVEALEDSLMNIAEFVKEAVKPAKPLDCDGNPIEDASSTTYDIGENDSLMRMIGKSDVSCTVIGDPSEDFAEACKIVCEFDEESKANSKRCEYACLAVNKLREEVLSTAKEISNKGEREKNGEGLNPDC